MAQSKSTAPKADEPVKVPTPDEAAAMRAQLAAFDRAQVQERNADLIEDLQPIKDAVESEGFGASHESLMTMPRRNDEELDRALRNYRSVAGNLVDLVRRKSVVAGLEQPTAPDPRAP